MGANFDRYKADIRKLVRLGEELQNSMSFAIAPAKVRAQLKESGASKEQIDEWISSLLPFNSNYELWYSESLSVIRQLLPDRLADFIRLYERPKNRKILQYDNYTIQDYMDGLRRGDGTVTTSAASQKFSRQLGILKACSARFESTLFEMKQLVQADLFDSEIDSARELLKHGFSRAAGAIAGVVLEKHLAQVCSDHKITVTKKHPGINDLNQYLKDGGVITVPQWRHITLLGDIRNLCDHSKAVEPTKEQVTDLLDGADKVLKTIS
ncbi:hypothetical protein [Bradyrhizobium sp. HKCCYLRH3061]|uniref:hypothetical protein n=1 Tax=Bradyrhizobium sp. HKCCYLRH3061 TaxID=3420734 RepID=UPI003EBBF5A5